MIGVSIFELSTATGSLHDINYRKTNTSHTNGVEDEKPRKECASPRPCYLMSQTVTTIDIHAVDSQRANSPNPRAEAYFENSS